MSSGPPGPGPSDEQIRVLHVDDQPSLLDATAAYLEREDDRFRVTKATSARDGLALLSETDFDCIVSDYDMPGQNGLDFLERVRENYPDIPFILFTGKVSGKVARDATSSGVTDYLQKRVGTEQYVLLADRIRNATD